MKSESVIIVINTIRMKRGMSELRILREKNTVKRMSAMIIKTTFSIIY